MRLRDTDISARAIGEETIILDLKDSRYLSVTGTGARLFELLEQDRSLDELVAAIMAEYDVERAVALSDTQRFVDQLRAAGLLEDQV